MVIQGIQPIRTVLVTGSSGLIGSEAVTYYDALGVAVHGVDNHLRAQLVGSRGDTRWNLQRLRRQCRRFAHHELDIRDRACMFALFEQYRFDLVIHCAAQPSHERAQEIPLDDFDINAVGTVNLLEATRRHSPKAVFVFMSTNKVYGDAPNELPLVERETRWDYARAADACGIDETCRTDQSMHSPYGASKLSADLMTQEYGRYFGLRTGVFRGGCLTGPNHSGSELHGFLSHLVKVAVRDEEYTVFGYRGKQVRDLIHSKDVVAAIDAFAAWPRAGEVYNIGGGRENSASILEVIAILERRLGRPVRWRYEERHRRGDHICYVSNLRKLTRHYPGWRIPRDLESIVDEMVQAEQARVRAETEETVATVGR
jgi:CDP-paratose 2-epimerase